MSLHWDAGTGPSTIRETWDKGLVPLSHFLMFNLFRQALNGLDDHIKFHFNPIEKIEGNRYRKADLTDKWNDLLHCDHLFSDRMGMASLQVQTASWRKRPVLF
jgi:hypothetical protein